ncbi:MAG: hypothetical protein L0Z50_26815 [Verrucomicrobiales bacterium]|nr:hypothetical protein [Verrucomicrobiales bacterium]
MESMEIGKNRIRIDISGNPALKEYFARKQAGERCLIEIEFLHDRVTDDAVEGTVESLSPEGYEPPANGDIPPQYQDKHITPTSKEPVMVAISTGTGY